MANIILKENIRNPQSQDDWITPFYVTDDNNIHINSPNRISANNVFRYVFIYCYYYFF